MSPTPWEPAPGATVTALTLAWDPALPSTGSLSGSGGVSGANQAAEYEVEIWTTAAGIPAEKVWEGTTHATTITPRDVSSIPQGPLAWQVRALNPGGHASAWGQSQLIYEIGIPTPISPPDGAIITAGQPLWFEWTVAAGAQSYQIDVATDSAFGNTVWTATTSDTSIIPPFPIGTDDLYWRVRGRAPGGSPGRSSLARRFTRIIGIPQDLLGPGGPSPTFAWTAVAGAASYNIQVSSTADFSGAPLWEADTVNNSITPVAAAFGTQTHYWRVRARDAGGFTGPWAEGGPFRLSSPVRQAQGRPDTVETLELQWPEPDAVLLEDPAFRWQWIDGAHGYVLEVSTSPAFSTLYDEVETSFNAYTPFTSLVQSNEQRQETYVNGTYFWRVRAIIPSATDMVSEVRRFTKAAKINLLEPVGNMSVSTDPAFRWEGIAGARQYALTVSSNTDFEPIWDAITLGFESYIPFSASISEQDTYANGTYFWKIEALDNASTKIATSDVGAFTKSAPLDLVAPADGAVTADTPTFIWHPVAGAYRYKLIVNTDPDTLTIYDQVTTDATQYTPYAGDEALAKYSDGVYQWMVEALDNLGQVITQSEPRQLIVDKHAETPASPTQTLTVPPSTTPTHTFTPTWTASPTSTSTPTRTPSLTPGLTPSETTAPISTPTATIILTPTTTPTATFTFTPTTTPTAMVSLTPMATASPSPTRGPGLTPSPTRTAGPTPTGDFMPPSPTPRPEGRTDTHEPNDDWTMAASLEPGTHQSYISHKRDLDWFKVYVAEPRSELRISLSNPPADFDLALLSDPDGITAGLPGIRALADLSDIGSSGQLTVPEDLEDIGALQDMRSVRAISARRDRDSEEVEASVHLQAGWYYVLVKGYNGAYSELPYSVRIEIDVPEENQYCTVGLPHPPGAIIARWVASEAPETMIIINKQRMDAYYGASPGSAEQLLAELRTLADHPRVNGVIEPVENNAQVVAAFRAWDEDACNPAAANRVAEAIKQHTDEVRELFPTIHQILIIGNDDIIPFYRVPDEVSTANESEYVSHVDANRESPFYSALKQGYILTDDFYVDDEPLAWRGRRLFVPDRPIGRLVETPDEMIDAIEAFLQTDGHLSLETGLVTGYDFSSGSSNQIADIMRDAGIAVDSMIAGPDAPNPSEGWTGPELRDKLLNTHHDVSMVNARFSHNEAASPEDDDSPLTAEAVTEVGSELRRSMFMSMGSHAGLNVPDRWADAPDRLDFSQAFCGLGIASVANTGYGYGTEHTAGYSELLILHLAQELVRIPDITVGEALTRAKQRFFRNAGPASFGAYHEKALIEASLFGIPNLHIAVPSRAIPTGNTRSVIPEPIEAVRQNLFVRSVTLEPLFEQVDTPTGSYFIGDDGTINRPGRPIQPRFTWDVEQPGVAAHGALLTGATYTNFSGFDPVITRPVTDTAGVEPDFPFDVWTPARIHTIYREPTADRAVEQLVVIPGQFRPASASSSYGVERRYDTLTYDIYYSTSPDWTPPIIWQVRLEKTALGAEFWVEVTDPSGIDRVVITYTRGDGEWETVELHQAGEFAWQALLPYFEADALEFMAQAVDVAGNVALSVDKGRLFGRRSHRVYLPLVNGNNLFEICRGDQSGQLSDAHRESTIH